MQVKRQVLDDSINLNRKSPTYRPLTTEVMLLAAQLWADARKRGKTTAEPNSLDGDVILAAQAILEVNAGNEVVIATTNVGHLSQFVDAREWRLIS